MVLVLAHRLRCARVWDVPDAPATILFVGDIVGGLGRRTLLGAAARAARAPRSRLRRRQRRERRRRPRASRRRSPTSSSPPASTSITLGNHTYRRQEIYPYLDAQRARSCGPANYLRSQPGRGCVRRRARRRAPRRRQPQRQPLPARRARRVRWRSTPCSAELEGKVDHVLVDMHAEATSEKVGMGWYLDGRVTAVVGTHTHVPTADAARAARRDRLHHRRRHDRPARRRDRRQARSRRSSRCARTCRCASRPPRTTRGSMGVARPLRRRAAARRRRSSSCSCRLRLRGRRRRRPVLQVRGRAARRARAGGTTRCRGRTSG